MKEQFVPYEIAIKLKEKGFDEPCFGTYGFNNIKPKKLYLPEDIREEFNERIDVSDIVNGINGDDVAAPLWQQVIDWLRTEHNIYLWVYKYYDDEVEKDLYRFDMKNGGFYSSFYNTSEEARQAAIEHALTLI